jgi:hypothetical protein
MKISKKLFFFFNKIGLGGGGYTPYYQSLRTKKHCILNMTKSTSAGNSMMGIFAVLWMLSQTGG